jgi:protein-disulfide isomerase
MKRFVKTILATVLCFTAAQTFAATNSTSAVSPAEKEKIEGVVRQYLINNPEVLVEAMQALQRKQYEQAEQTVKQTQKTAANFVTPLFHQNNDPIAGNPNGKVTVVEFFDYQCPHCVDMAPVMSAIIKANPNLRVVFKDFPIRGPISELAARAAVAANKQGKYPEFSHALLTSTKPLSEEVIFKIAGDTGLDVTQLKKDMSDASVTAQLKANTKLAQDLKLFGTPAFFIGKTDAKTTDNINYVPGQMNEKQLQEAIDKAS